MQLRTQTKTNSAEMILVIYKKIDQIIMKLIIHFNLSTIMNEIQIINGIRSDLLR